MRRFKFLLNIAAILFFSAPAISNGDIASSRKYHPGHYVTMVKSNGSDHQTMLDSIKPNVVGFNKRYSWHDLEPSYGQYDFSQIDADLALLAGQGMQLVTLIVDKSFLGEKYTPEYLWQYQTLPNNTNGYTSKRWATYVVTRMKALLAALGNRYDAHPNFEGVAIQESALDLDDAVLDANGYTPEMYRDALIDVISGAAQSFPTSRVFWYMSFLERNNSYIGDIASAVTPYGVVIGSPHILPDSANLQRQVYPLYDQFQGQMPLFGSMQYASYRHAHQDASFPTRYWAMDELFRFARDDLHVNYIFWTRVPSPLSTDSYDWTDAIPVIGNNSVFNQDQVIIDVLTVNNTEPTPPPTNNAPQLSGAPSSSVTAGYFYSFQPEAFDADSNDLTFSIQNRPAWGNFNSSNGYFSGTPTETDVGTYSNIVITVSDGVAVDTIGPFTITVSSSGNGNITSARKYHPGHYVMLLRWNAGPSTMIKSIKPNVVGFQKRYYWSDLEPSLGQYDFSQIDADLALLADQGMQLIALIEDRSFKDEKPTPPYLWDDYTLANVSSQSALLNGYIAKRWDPYVVTRMKALMAALGNRYDSHPNFEGVAVQESAIGLDKTVRDANGYTPEKYRDALIDVISGAAQSFPTSRVFWYMNFLIGNQSYIGDVASAVAPYGVVLGGPDVLPEELSLQSKVYPFYDQFQGQMPLFGSMQPSSYSHEHNPDDGYPTKYWTMDEMFRYARDNLHVNYVFWTRQAWPSPKDSYSWANVIPVIGNNPAFNQ